MANSSKRVILTGASGFIGANLTRRLLEEGNEVHLLIRPAEARWRLDSVLDKVCVHEVTLQQRALVESIVLGIDPEWVFHLAAYGSYSTQSNVESIITTNYNGTVNLVEACLKTGFQSFVNAGSSSEYGYKDHAPLESELPEPNSHYAASKAAATLYCQYIATRCQRQLRTLRLYSVYGSWEEPTRLMPTLTLAGLRGELPPLVSPSIARDFVYVDDVVDAFLIAAEPAAEDLQGVFNVGTGSQTTLQSLIEDVRRIFNISTEPVWGSMPDRGWDTDVWVADPTLVKSRLGWKPTHTLEDGLRNFADWLLTEPGMRQFYESSRNPPR
jgi:nucleoside-diphosphate-sugar epimerase